VTAGRTDAGVHGYANSCHVDLARRHKKTKEIISPFPALTVKKATNFYIRKKCNDVYITKVEAVENSFHARFACLSRTYIYKIVESRDASGWPLLHDTVMYCHRQLDLDKMKEAAAIFVGTHDFTSFCSPSDKSATRTIYSVDVTVEPSEMPLLSGQRLIHVRVKGQSFVWHQVRKMVGGIVAVGYSKITLENLQEILDAKDASRTPSMAPACGLFFLEAEYPPYTVLGSSENADEVEIEEKNTEEEGEQTGRKRKGSTITPETPTKKMKGSEEIVTTNDVAC